MGSLWNGIKHFILFAIGGVIYIIIEMLWRGYSHWSMFIVGGLAFILIGLINEWFSYNIPFWKQCAIATLMITAIEFISGYVVNLWLGWNVWNYTVLDVFGQISLPFMVVWYALSVVGIILDDLLRWKLFSEEKPHYTVF